MCPFCWSGVAWLITGGVSALVVTAKIYNQSQETDNKPEGGEENGEQQGN